MDATVSVDELLQALANSHRRIVLRELATRPAEECPVSVLEETVLDGIDRSPPPVRTRSEIAIQLRHVHLPTLDDVGLCDYDADRERVAYVPDEFAESLLERIDQRSRTNQLH
ncbi:hypothetical protein GCM10028857_00620 [Salinarchaeum chitinilyticum]